MTRLQAFGIALLLLATIFLPSLGDVELKGEEGRRVLPAVTMLETGNWLVPYIGGEPYLRKPPLIHWAVAAAFQLTGHRDEWSARLPSVLSMLLLAGVIIAVGSRWLTPPGALMAAIFSLTNLGMMEKGRLIELEALYVAVTGAAFACWLSWWREERSRWLIWTVPFLFLGLGLLIKGPLHLLFFYGVVVAILYYPKRLRELLTLPHLAGVLLMLGIFALWAVPYFQAIDPAKVWRDEFVGRMADSKGSFAQWMENFWNNFENFVPWLLLVPLWWKQGIVRAMDPRDAVIFCGMRLAVVALGCGSILIPGVVSRYTLPLVVPASILLAMALRSPGLLSNRVTKIWRFGLIIIFAVAAIGALASPFLGQGRLQAWWSGAAILFLAGLGLILRKKFTAPVHLTIGTAMALALGVLTFSMVKVPQILLREKARPAGRMIDAALPAGSDLYVVNVGYQPALFAVRAPCIYLLSLRDVPHEARFVLIQSSVKGKLPVFNRATRILANVAGRNKSRLVLLAVDL